MPLDRSIRQLSVPTILAVMGCASSLPKRFLERVQWGSAPEALGPHLEIVRDERLAKRLGRCYRRQDEGPVVDGVASRDTEYCFNRGALYSVRTHFDGEELRGRWHQCLTEIYGRPQTDWSGGPNWNAKDVRISLRYVTTNYYGPEETGTVTWTQRRYEPPYDSNICEPWDAGFRACMERERVRIQAIDAR